MSTAKHPCTKCRRLEKLNAKLEGKLEALEAALDKALVRPDAHADLRLPQFPGPTGMDQLRASLEAEQAKEDRGKDPVTGPVPGGIKGLLQRIAEVHESTSGVLPDDTEGIVWLSDPRPAESPAE